MRPCAPVGRAFPLPRTADELAPSEQSFLAARGTTQAGLRELQQAVRQGRLKESSSLYKGVLQPPRPGDVQNLSPRGTREAEELEQIGRQALSQGLARVVYAGGRATRFGGAVKGTVDVVPGKSFLQLLLADARAAARRNRADIPFVIMSSDGSTEPIRRHLVERGVWGDDIQIFEQGLSARLNPDGSIFRGADGKPSYYPPGHGDFFRAFRDSRVLGQLRDRGIRHVFTSNVDNVGATLDPRVIGHHVRSGKDMTAEVTQRRPADKGGALVRADGQLRLMEGMRLPESLDLARFPEFSINNFTYRLNAPLFDLLGGKIPLDAHLVRKEVEGRDALQAETITAEATGVVHPDGTPVMSLGALRVPREGLRSFDEGRFYPVKTREDLGVVAQKIGAASQRQEDAWE